MKLLLKTYRGRNLLLIFLGFQIYFILFTHIKSLNRLSVLHIVVPTVPGEESIDEVNVTR
jgi:hypothetical protein